MRMYVIKLDIKGLTGRKDGAGGRGGERLAIVCTSKSIRLVLERGTRPILHKGWFTLHGEYYSASKKKKYSLLWLCKSF